MRLTTTPTPRNYSVKQPRVRRIIVINQRSTGVTLASIMSAVATRFNDKKSESLEKWRKTRQTIKLIPDCTRIQRKPLRLLFELACRCSPSQKIENMK